MRQSDMAYTLSMVFAIKNRKDAIHLRGVLEDIYKAAKDLSQFENISEITSKVDTYFEFLYRNFDNDRININAKWLITYGIIILDKLRNEYRSRAFRFGSGSVVEGDSTIIGRVTTLIEQISKYRCGRYFTSTVYDYSLITILGDILELSGVVLPDMEDPSFINILTKIDDLIDSVSRIGWGTMEYISILGDELMLIKQSLNRRIMAGYRITN